VRDHSLKPTSKQKHLGHQDLALKAYAIHRILLTQKNKFGCGMLGKGTLKQPYDFVLNAFSHAVYCQ
jgi:hypothetical protein